MTSPMIQYIPWRNDFMWLSKCSGCAQGLLRESFHPVSTCFECKAERKRRAGIRFLRMKRARRRKIAAIRA